MFDIFKNSLDVEHIFETISVVATVIRYFTLLANKHNVEEAFHLCKSLWKYLKENEYSIVQRNERKLRILYKVYFVDIVVCFIFISSFAYFIKLSPMVPDGPSRRILPFGYGQLHASKTDEYSFCQIAKIWYQCNRDKKWMQQINKYWMFFKN